MSHTSQPDTETRARDVGEDDVPDEGDDAGEDDGDDSGEDEGDDAGEDAGEDADTTSEDKETPDQVFDREWGQYETADYKRNPDIKQWFRDADQEIKSREPECHTDKVHKECGHADQAYWLQEKVKWLEFLLRDAERFIRDKSSPYCFR